MSNIPMVDSPEDIESLTTGTMVEVDGDEGIINVL